MAWVSWLIFGVLLLLGIYLFRTDPKKRKIRLAIIIILGLFLYFSISSMVKSNDISINSPKGIVNSVTLYFNWLATTAVNLWDVGTKTVHMTGSAIKMNSSKTDNRP